MAPNSFIYLNAGSSVGGNVWEGVRDVALEEVCHWGLESLSLLLVDQ